MCRNIKTLFNFEPPATEQEVRAASLQFVRKLSGFNAPSKANEATFNQAVNDISAIASVLLASLSTKLLHVTVRLKRNAHMNDPNCALRA
jgi:hypothetical protein